MRRWIALFARLTLTASAALTSAVLAPALLASGSAPSDGFVTIVPRTEVGAFAVKDHGSWLDVRLRVAFSFIDGDPGLAPGFAPCAYRWLDREGVCGAHHEAEANDEQDAFRAEFRRRVETLWGGVGPLEPASGPSPVDVEVLVEEVPLADAHWLILVPRYPRDAPQDFFETSVCASGSHHVPGACALHHTGFGYGTIQITSAEIDPVHVRDLQVASFDLWYDVGSAQPPPTLLELPQIDLLAANADWSAELIAYAGWDETGYGRGATGADRSIELARERAQVTRRALVDRLCEGSSSRAECAETVDARIRTVTRGAFGEAPNETEDRRLVRLSVHRLPPLDVVAHEVGHALGLGDEASNEFQGAGGPLSDSRYAALVAHHFDEILRVRDDDDSIMGRGAALRPWHAVTFLEALETLRETVADPGRRAASRRPREAHRICPLHAGAP